MISLILLKLFTFSQILQGVPKLLHATVYIYMWRVQMQKPLSAIWFLSGSYIYVQLFHFNCIENDLYIAIWGKLLNLNIAAW